MNEQKQDQIDRYVRGEMTGEERQRFESELMQDAELRKEYEFIRQVQDTLKDRKEKVQLMAQWDEEEKYDMKTAALYRRRRAFRIAGGLLLVAVLIVGFFLFMPFRKGTTMQEMPQLDMSLYESYRSGGAIPQIASLIRQKQYEEALKRIETEESVLVVPDTVTPATDEEREQIAYEVAATRLDADHLRWLKVYALMGLERRDEALRLLDELRRSAGVYQQKADSLYQILK